MRGFDFQIFAIVVLAFFLMSITVAFYPSERLANQRLEETLEREDSIEEFEANQKRLRQNYLEFLDRAREQRELERDWGHLKLQGWRKLTGDSTIEDVRAHLGEPLKEEVLDVDTAIIRLDPKREKSLVHQVRANRLTHKIWYPEFTLAINSLGKVHSIIPFRAHQGQETIRVFVKPVSKKRKSAYPWYQGDLSWLKIRKGMSAQEVQKILKTSNQPVEVGDFLRIGEESREAFKQRQREVTHSIVQPNFQILLDRQTLVYSIMGVGRFQLMIIEDFSQGEEARSD